MVRDFSPVRFNERLCRGRPGYDSSGIRFGISKLKRHDVFSKLIRGENDRDQTKGKKGRSFCGKSLYKYL